MFCSFCGEYYKQAEALPARCRRCGYDMSLHGRVDAIEVSFGAAVKRVAFDGDELYHTWRQMAVCSRRGNLFCAVDGEELSVCSFLGSVMAGMRSFAPNTAAGCCTRLVFSREITCEDTNSLTGCCAWTTRLCRIGVFHLDELTPQERTLFIKWLFANDPQVSAAGRLQFDLSIKVQPGEQ